MIMKCQFKDKSAQGKTFLTAIKKKMPTGYVYRIISPSQGVVYFGSTGQKSLRKRLAQHRYNFVHFPDCNRRVNQVLKYADAVIEELEKVEYTDVTTLLQREGFYIRNHACTNSRIAEIGRAHV